VSSPNLILAGLILIQALHPDQFILKPSIADKKPGCGRHKRYIEEKVVGEPKGNHLKGCALNRKGKSKGDINEHPTVWPSPDRRGQLISDSNHFLGSLFAFCFAMIAARTASNGDAIDGMPQTAKNRRLVLPSIGEDHA
jgi:hypothetical protein